MPLKAGNVSRADAEGLADVLRIRLSFAGGHVGVLLEEGRLPRRTRSRSMMSSWMRSPEWKSSMAAPTVANRFFGRPPAIRLRDRPAQVHEASADHLAAQRELDEPHGRIGTHPVHGRQVFRLLVEKSAQAR